jgi:hypothetical protein
MVEPNTPWSPRQELENRNRTALFHLELIEVLLVVLLLGAAIFAGIYLARTYFWLGTLVFVAALFFRNKIEDWFIDLRERFL